MSSRLTDEFNLLIFFIFDRSLCGRAHQRLCGSPQKDPTWRKHLPVWAPDLPWTSFYPDIHLNFPPEFLVFQFHLYGIFFDKGSWNDWQKMTSPPQGGPPSPTWSHPPPRGQAPPSSCQEQAILCQRSPSWSGGCSTISSLFPNPISSNLSSSPPGPPIQVISPLSEHPGEWYSAKSLEVKRLSICLSKRYLASLAWLGKTAIAMALISRYCSHPQIDIGAVWFVTHHHCIALYHWICAWQVTSQWHRGCLFSTDIQLLCSAQVKWFLQ